MNCWAGVFDSSKILVLWVAADVVRSSIFIPEYCCLVSCLLFEIVILKVVWLKMSDLWMSVAMLEPSLLRFIELVFPGSLLNLLDLVLYDPVTVSSAYLCVPVTSSLSSSSSGLNSSSSSGIWSDCEKVWIFYNWGRIWHTYSLSLK